MGRDKANVLRPKVEKLERDMERAKGELNMFSEDMVQTKKDIAGAANFLFGLKQLLEAKGIFFPNELETFVHNMNVVASTNIVERPCQAMDYVKLTYVGTVDDKEFEGGTSKPKFVRLGVGGFVPGFEENITGMIKGESKEFFVTFPADYRKEDLRGKEAKFKVELQEIREVASEQ